MNIVIPINFAYLMSRYGLDAEFAGFLKNFVVPDFVIRLSRDRRVSWIEVISDFDFQSVIFGLDKLVVTHHGVETCQDADDVVSLILRMRQTESPLIVQCNPLFPFVALDSLFRAYSAVEGGAAASAVGSLRDKLPSRDSAHLLEDDLGIFTVYSASGPRPGRGRVAGPLAVIGLGAVELIGLRNRRDFDLFNLVVNSGFEL